MMSPAAGSIDGFGVENSKQKNHLRTSSSLQDFSSYHRLDPNTIDIISGIERNLTRSKQTHEENGVPTFSKEKTSSKKGFTRKRWVRLLLILLGVASFALLVYALQLFYSNRLKGRSKYYVVLDCGSTGTRAYVYQASVNHERDGNFPILLRSLPEGHKPSMHSGRAYNRMETQPGLSKLVSNISGLNNAIKPLLQWAETQIPQNALESTSLFLYATAGVRRLQNSESEWLLNSAWSIIKESKFLCRREWVKVITGVEEAYYGWIALNYHTGVLGIGSKRGTFGAADLGGSSLQVTFESKEQLKNNTGLMLKIGRDIHHLVAYSLAGYGLNDAFDESVVHLLNRLPPITNAKNIEIKHPCLQTGYNEQYSCSQCEPAGAKIQLMGAQNWEECSSLAKIAVNLSEQSDLPRPYGKFYAMSGFYVVFRFFNLTSDASLDDVLKKGKEFCEKTWDVAKNSVVPQPFIEQYCFRSPYIVFLLREGLHISDQNVTVGSGSITWTLGVALLEAAKNVSTRTGIKGYEMLQIKINPLIIFGVLFGSLIFFVCGVFWVCDWRKKIFQRMYLPLFTPNNASTTSGVNIPNPFHFKRWSRISLDAVKMPLSPIASAQNRAFGNGFELMESSSLYHPTSSSSLSSGVFNSYSPGSLGQMHLQSRRSQSREDLHSSLAEAHLVKV